MVQVRLLPSPDGTSPGWSHDKVLDESSPGVVPSKSGAVSRWGSSALHDKVLDESSPGVVQVRVVPSPDGGSSALHDKVLDVVLAWCSTSKSTTICGWLFSFITGQISR